MARYDRYPEPLGGAAGASDVRRRRPFLAGVRSGVSCAAMGLVDQHVSEESTSGDGILPRSLSDGLRPMQIRP